MMTIRIDFTGNPTLEFTNVRHVIQHFVYPAEIVIHFSEGDNFRPPVYVGMRSVINIDMVSE